MLNRDVWFYFSFDGKNEVYDIGGRIHHAKRGTLLLAFLECDWEKYFEECEWMLKSITDVQLLSYEFARWYYESCKKLERTHVLFGFWAQKHMWRRMRNYLMDMGYMDDSPDCRFLDAFWKGSKVETVLSADSRVKFCRMFCDEFVLFTKLAKDILELVDSVLVLERGEKDSEIAERYYANRNCTVYNRVTNREIYETNAYCLCDGVSTEFRTARINNRPTIISLWGSENLPSIIFLAFDLMAMYKVGLRRCNNCGLLFIPRSVTSCYCGRTAPGQISKTCKELGAAIEHQKKIENSEARKLYIKIQNRHRNYISRYKNGGRAKKKYDAWKKETDVYFKRVEQGDMSFDEFMEIIDIDSQTALSKYEVNAGTSE